MTHLTILTLIRLLIFCLITGLTAGQHVYAQESQQETESTEAEESQENSTEDNPEENTDTLPTAVRNPRLDLPSPTAIAYSQQNTLDIQRAIEADRYRSVTIDDTEALFIISEANIALTKGVAIIIGESGRNSLSHNALSELVSPLNDYGWVTIMVPAPDYSFAAKNGDHFEEPEDTESQPETDSQPETTENSDTGATENSPEQQQVFPFEGFAHIGKSDFENHESQMLELMQEVVEHSSTYPGFFLVIAQGSSAAWLAKIYSEQKLPQPDALVAISPNWPEQQYNKNLPDYIAQIPAPVLDIYSQWDNEWTRKTAKKRAVAAERALKLHYRQREIIGQPYNKQQFIYIAKEIYGWLTYMGW